MSFTRTTGGFHGLTAGIIATGTEIAQALVQERNAHHLASELTGMGCVVGGWRVVPDDPRELRIALDEFARFDVVIVTGGTGATPMDQTFAVVSEWAERSLTEDTDVLALLVELAETQNAGSRAEWLRAARKQARVPVGAIVIMPAPHATAPAVVLPPSRSRDPVIVALPGPPSEAKALWPSVLATEPLRELLATRTRFDVRTVRLTADAGLSETLLGATVKRVLRGLPGPSLNTSVCFAAGGSELNVVTLLQPGQLHRYTRFEEEVVATFPTQVYSVTGDTVDDIVRRLAGEDATCAVLDLVTAGRIATRLQKSCRTHTVSPDPSMPRAAAFDLVRRLGIATASSAMETMPGDLCQTLGADIGVVLLHPDPGVGVLVCGQADGAVRRRTLELTTWPGGSRMPAEVMHEVRRLLETQLFAR